VNGRTALANERRFAGRAGLKLDSALEHFGLEPTGVVACDLGSHVGGFVDCLLARGATRVYAVEVGSGVLAWKLRQDPRVIVMERTSALKVRLPEKVDLVTVDVGWTPQRLVLPPALKLLTAGGKLLSLVKPQYEADRGEVPGGVVPESKVSDIVDRVADGLTRIGIQVSGVFKSPLPGSGGNIEYFFLVQGST